MLEFPNHSSGVALRARSADRVSVSRGFSLLEVIIVLTIMLVMATVSVYAAQNLLPRIKLDSVAKAHDVLLKRMRLLAIKRSIDVNLRVEDSSEAPRTVAFVNGNPDRDYFLVARNVADDSFLASTPLPDQRKRHVELLDISFPGEAIRFTKIGDVASAGTLRYGITMTPIKRLVRAVTIPNLTGRSEVDSYEDVPP